MVVLNMLISVYHAEPEFFDDWSPIHLIARLLINRIDIYIYIYIYIYILYNIGWLTV